MMTWRQFDARLTNIEDQAQAQQERVDGFRDQQMALLFAESERSQQELAAHLGEVWGKDVSQSWVCCHLRFGRFIRFFITTGNKDEWKLPTNLTERAFRRFWEATSGGNFSGHKANTEAAVEDERRRFAEIIEELKGSVLTRKKKPVRNAIIKKLGGKDVWLTTEQITERIAGDFDEPVPTVDVFNCLRHWNPTDKQPYRVEKAGQGDTARYRVVKVKGQVVSRRQISEWSHELVPMLEELIREAKKDRVEISLSTLCALASKIKKVMESVVAHAPTKE